MGHYARMCRMKQPEANKKKTNIRKKVNVVHPKSPWSKSEDDSAGKEVEVMHIDNIERGKNKPFVLNGTFNRRSFHAFIDTGSPVTIFTKAHVQKIVGKDYKLRPLEQNEKYIDFSSNKINFLGAMIGQVESGARKLDRVSALIAENES